MTAHPQSGRGSVVHESVLYDHPPRPRSSRTSIVQDQLYGSVPQLQQLQEHRQIAPRHLAQQQMMRSQRALASSSSQSSNSPPETSGLSDGFIGPGGLNERLASVSMFEDDRLTNWQEHQPQHPLTSPPQYLQHNRRHQQGRQANDLDRGVRFNEQVFDAHNEFHLPATRFGDFTIPAREGSPPISPPLHNAAAGGRGSHIDARASIDQNPPVRRFTSHQCALCPYMIFEWIQINTLYVGNLPTSTSNSATNAILEESLRQTFSRCQGYRKLCFRQKSNGPMCFVEVRPIGSWCYLKKI
jgi:hypothetical protein